MKTTYVYPGSFCPPTLGHLQILKKAARLFSKVYVVCSVNPEKRNGWFTPDECKKFWQTYPLPKNVRITAIDSFKKTVSDLSSIVMLRGLRNSDDFDHEKRTVFFNQRKFGINKYFYFISDDNLKDVSSTKVRWAARHLKFDELSDLVSPLIISALLEKILRVKNIFLVIGRPGSGKSTFLKILCQKDRRNVHVNTDEFAKKITPLLMKVWGEQNLIKIFLDPKESPKKKLLNKIIKKPWLNLLRESLKKVPPHSNVFVEIPYGLQKDKLMFKYVGGKIIHFHCQNETNKKRVKKRG
ncbi:MAG: adenylyltransferase/cytidyltransferase family protein, partial [Patescibacteria group bacterium]|nr:adenylyltransferase/cytidyltransferase family protein [Patescibacteria group bacterium]